MEQRLLEERKNFALLQEKLEHYLGLILRESHDFHALQQDLEEYNKSTESKFIQNQSKFSHNTKE